MLQVWPKKAKNKQTKNCKVWEKRVRQWRFFSPECVWVHMTTSLKQIDIGSIKLTWKNRETTNKKHKVDSQKQKKKRKRTQAKNKSNQKYKVQG